MIKKLLPVFLIILLIQVLLIGKSSSFGMSITEVDQKLEILKEENKELEVKVASFSSCLVVSQRMQELGIDKNSLVVNKNDDPSRVALRP